ncbi:MAG: hypothetical protein ACRCUE_10965 [Bosea sp. (in: a-proteobacteria)]
MNIAARALGLATFALMVGLPIAPALAQQADRCNDYANQMMSFDQRARQMQCKSWNKPKYTYQGFYNVCQRSSPAQTQDFINQWGSNFQRCEFEASGSPAAQPTRPAAGGVQWLAGNGQSCDAVCSRGGRKAVTSGTFQNGNPFHVCRAGDNRPGFNLQPSWSKICVVPMGVNRTVDATTYACACQ